VDPDEFLARAWERQQRHKQHRYTRFDRSVVSIFILLAAGVPLALLLYLIFR
jgi:hypothetical protein